MMEKSVSLPEPRVPLSDAFSFSFSLRTSVLMAECSVLVILTDGVFFHWLEQRSLQATDLGRSPAVCTSTQKMREIGTMSGVFITLN